MTFSNVGGVAVERFGEVFLEKFGIMQRRCRKTKRLTADIYSALLVAMGYSAETFIDDCRHNVTETLIKMTIKQVGVDGLLQAPATRAVK
jgi:hypothetical protein